MAKKPKFQPTERHTEIQPKEGHKDQPEERLPTDSPQKAKASCSKCGKRIPLDRRGRSKQKACLRCGKKVPLDQEGQTVEHKGQDQDKMDSRSPESKKPLMQRNVGWCNPKEQVSYRQEKPTEVRGDEKVTRSESHTEQSIASTASQEEMRVINERVDRMENMLTQNTAMMGQLMTMMQGMNRGTNTESQPNMRRAEDSQSPKLMLKREVSVLKSLYKKSLRENQELQGQIRVRDAELKLHVEKKTKAEDSNGN